MAFVVGTVAWILVKGSLLAEAEDKNHESGIEKKKDKSFIYFDSPACPDK